MEDLADVFDDPAVLEALFCDSPFSSKDDGSDGAGHIREWLREFGSLARHSNVSMESFVATIRRYVLNRSQKDGNGGCSIVEDIGRYNMRRYGQVCTLTS